MKGYYFISPNGSEFLYLDCVLFSYRHLHQDRPHNEFSPEVLRNLCLAERSGILSKSRLEERGWDFEEIDVSDKIVGDFINSCFRGRSKRRLNNRATRIFNLVFDHSRIARDNGLNGNESGYSGSPDYSGKREIVHEGGFKEIVPVDDDEDIDMDWWKRGEEWVEGWDL